MANLRLRRQRVAAAICGLVAILTADGCKKTEESAEPEAVPEATATRPISLELQVDQIAGTPALPAAVTVGGNEVSLESIFATAGVTVQVRRGSSSLSGPAAFSDGDLMGYLRNRVASAQVYCLIAGSSKADPSLRGELFASDSRDGIAIFTSDLGAQSSDFVNQELTRRGIHELLHAFNVHHDDRTGGLYTGGTLESSSDASTVDWQLTSATLAHFADHPLDELMPNSGFSFKSVSQEHIDGHSFQGDVYTPVIFGPEEAASVQLVTSGAPSAAESIATPPDESSSLRLRLLLPKEGYALGEPVVAMAVLESSQASDTRVASLQLEAGALLIEVQDEESLNPRPFVPLALHDSAAVAASGATVSSSRPLVEEIRPFFGGGGWTFSKPGRYRIFALYRPDPSAELPLIRAEASINVAQAQGPPFRLDRATGRFLLHEKAAGIEAVRERLLRFVREQPAAPAAAAVRLALANEALEPAVDVRTGRRPEPEVDLARELLHGIESERQIGGVSPASYVRAAASLALARVARGEAGHAGELIAALRRARQAMAASGHTADQRLLVLETSVRRRLAAVTSRLDLSAAERRALAPANSGGKS